MLFVMLADAKLSHRTYSCSLVLVLTLALGGCRYGSGVDTGEPAAAEESCAPLSINEHPSTDTVHRQIWIPVGEFVFGANDRYLEEKPAQRREVRGFWIDVHEVTNRQFAAFVAATGYRTLAERQPAASEFPDIPEHLLQAGSAVFVPPLALRDGGRPTEWWQFVPGASWRQPSGPGSSIAGRERHPVVHIAWADAQAYAQWAGRALPTEVQWEYAAGHPRTILAASYQPADPQTANTWQGLFPLRNRALDGYIGTSPVGCYPPDERGLYDMIGNVWEWVADAYQPGHAVDDAEPRIRPAATLRVIKGGSHLCAENYCQRDRPQARQGQEANFSTGHTGFRTVDNNRAPPDQ